MKRNNIGSECLLSTYHILKYYFSTHGRLSLLILTRAEVLLRVSIVWLRKWTYRHVPMFTLLESGGGGI